MIGYFYLFGSYFTEYNAFITVLVLKYSITHSSDFTLLAKIITTPGCGLKNKWWLDNLNSTQSSYTLIIYLTPFSLITRPFRGRCPRGQCPLREVVHRLFRPKALFSIPWVFLRLWLGLFGLGRMIDPWENNKFLLLYE